MAYNTKPIVTDKDGNPISQYYNPITDEYEPVEGANGANKVLVENNDLSLQPILDKLSQLTGTVIDEETRKSNELQRIDSEDARQSNEDIRNNNEAYRVGNEDARVQNENLRSQKENTREANEQNRIDLYNDLMNKVSTGYFDGKNLEFHWDGTSLGVRVEGEIDYLYVDLKGDTGDIDNLTSQHILDALGYTPANESDLANKVDKSRVLTDVPANAKFTDTTYSEITTAEIDVGTASTLRTVTGRRIKYIIDKIVALFPTKTSELTNDSGFLTNVTKNDVGLGNVDNVKQMPISNGVLENYREKLVTLSGTSPTINLNSGNVFAHTLSGNTTYSISNAQAQAHSFTLIITQGATARTITFPASIKWTDDEIPDMTKPNTKYRLTFLTIDGGVTWEGMFGGGRSVS